jgi:hypothetical protein
MVRRHACESRAKPWEGAFGGLRDLRWENRRIDRLMDAEFGIIHESERR